MHKINGSGGDDKELCPIHRATGWCVAQSLLTVGIKMQRLLGVKSTGVPAYSNYCTLKG
jgi:hypothetical protein